MGDEVKENDHYFVLIGVGGQVKCTICLLELHDYFLIPIAEKLPRCLTDEEIIIKKIIE